MSTFRKDRRTELVCVDLLSRAAVRLIDVLIKLHHSDRNLTLDTIICYLTRAPDLTYLCYSAYYNVSRCAYLSTVGKSLLYPKD